MYCKMYYLGPSIYDGSSFQQQQARAKNLRIDHVEYERVFQQGCGGWGLHICMPDLALDEQPFIMIGVIGARAGKMIKEWAIHYNGPLS